MESPTPEDTLDAWPEDLKIWTLPNLAEDVYLCLPRNRLFIRFLNQGDPLEIADLQKVSVHSDPRLYAVLPEVKSSAPVGAVLSSDRRAVFREYLDLSPGALQKRQLVEGRLARTLARLDWKGAVDAGLSAELSHQIGDSSLQKAFSELFDQDSSDPGQVLNGLRAGAEEILLQWLPRSHRIYVALSAPPELSAIVDASLARAGLAILCAWASGYALRSTLEDLSTACLFMDLSFSDAPAETRHWDGHAPEEWPRDMVPFLRQHPLRSYLTLAQNVRGLSNQVLQMVLTHHEAAGGQGFPRGVRAEQLPILNRILILGSAVCDGLVWAQGHVQARGLLQALELEARRTPPRHTESMMRSFQDFLAQRFGRSFKS